MEDFLHHLLGDNITVVLLFLIVGFCWLSYIPGHQNN